VIANFFSFFFRTLGFQVLGPRAEDGDMPRFSIEPRQKVG